MWYKTNGEIMSILNKDTTVGVIVARFQVPALHEGHRYVLDYVLERHTTVLVILGVSYAMTDRNPLSYEMRKGMLEDMYPNQLVVVPSNSLPSSYEERSRRIDEVIENAFPNQNAVVYGSRDSFVHTYQGKFPTEEVPTVFSGSATDIRQNVGVINSDDFRSGVVYANMHRKQIAYSAVDVGIVDHSVGKVLLVSKDDEEGGLRFPGVFFNPEIDDSYEAAGLRCIEKEMPGVQVASLKIIRSLKIDDWRFSKTKDSIVTLLMITQYVSGEARPGKGVDGIEWIPVYDLPRRLIENHRLLGKIFHNNWYNGI
jgi:bifunctional NMN adenylyltransferase/nudix hydrolase